MATKQRNIMEYHRIKVWISWDNKYEKPIVAGLVNIQKANWKMAIDSEFSHEKWWIFPVRYVKLPEGKPNLGRISSNFLMVSGVLRFLIGPYHGDWGSGWWLTKHLEKYDFANGKNDIPYYGKLKIFETTNQIYIYHIYIENKQWLDLQTTKKKLTL